MLLSRCGKSLFNIKYLATNFSKNHASSVATLLEEMPLGDASIQGWIRSVRKMKNYSFVDINDGSTSRILEVVVPKDLKEAKGLTVGSSVKVKGKLQEKPKGGIELYVESLDIIGPCVITEGYPLPPKKVHPNEVARHVLHFRPRTTNFSSLLRIRNVASKAIRDFWSEERFTEVHAPIITACDCEGAGEIFKVVPCSKTLVQQMIKDGLSEDEAFFGSEAYLSVSGQMHLEAVARSLGNVYTFGPTFRAENSKSRLHLSEFYMLEAESAFTDKLDDIMAIIEKMLRKVTKDVLDRSESDIQSIRKVQIEHQDLNVQEYPLDPVSVDTISSTFLSSEPYKIMTYNEAMDILINCGEKFEVLPEMGHTLAKEHELFLVKYNSNRPIFVINWPISLKPFYMKMHDDGTVSALDLLVPVVGELCGGSLREDELDTLQKRMKENSLDKKMQWYVQLRKFGNIPTGGFGMGFERYLQSLLMISNIKDTIPFPRWPYNCKM